MAIMEQAKGVEALGNLPIRDVLRPKDETIAVLTARTQENIIRNATSLADTIQKQAPEEEELIGKLRLIAQDTKESFPVGGFSVEERDYDKIASGDLGTTFTSFLKNFIGNYVPTFFERKGNVRDPGVMTMGYFLDFMKMVRPEIASEEDVVKCIIDVMRDPAIQLSPGILGAMVDDSMQMISNGSFPFDFLTSIPDTENFDEYFLRNATEKEIDEYNAAKSLKVVVLIKHRISKFSQN